MQQNVGLDLRLVSSHEGHNQADSSPRPIVPRRRSGCCVSNNGNTERLSCERFLHRFHTFSRTPVTNLQDCFLWRGS